MVEHVEWVKPLIGGALIGLAASLLLLLQGRIFGVTGIISGALFNRGEERKWISVIKTLLVFLL